MTVVTGAPHATPSVDRLVTTALPWTLGVSSNVSDDTSHTPWAAS